MSKRRALRAIAEYMANILADPVHKRTMKLLRMSTGILRVRWDEPQSKQQPKRKTQ